MNKSLEEAFALADVVSPAPAAAHHALVVLRDEVLRRRGELGELREEVLSRRECGAADTAEILKLRLSLQTTMRRQADRTFTAGRDQAEKTVSLEDALFFALVGFEGVQSLPTEVRDALSLMREEIVALRELLGLIGLDRNVLIEAVPDLGTMEGIPLCRLLGSMRPAPALLAKTGANVERYLEQFEKLRLMRVPA